MVFSKTVDIVIIFWDAVADADSPSHQFRRHLRQIGTKRYGWRRL